jgi:hypothetical protein
LQASYQWPVAGVPGQGILGWRLTTGLSWKLQLVRSEDDGTNELTRRALLFLEFVDRSRCPIGFTTVAPDLGQQKPGQPGRGSTPFACWKSIRPDRPRRRYDGTRAVYAGNGRGGGASFQSRSAGQSNRITRWSVLAMQSATSRDQEQGRDNRRQAECPFHQPTPP